jgi:hypothetical protein
VETVKVIELTDEEIWLRAYCASVGNRNHAISEWDRAANKCLFDFKKRFKGEENDK